MSKVTSKLRVSVPKAPADQHGVAPGDDLVWKPAGAALRVRLRLFDAATRRQARRQSRRKLSAARTRGWTRDEPEAGARP
jgi:hypothetical protein